MVSAAYGAQGRVFMAQAWEELERGDLRQASEKAWGAASHMAKAVACANGWSYDKHSDFFIVARSVWELTGDDRVRRFSGIANNLHTYFYERSRNLSAQAIEADIEDVAGFVDLLAPLTVPTDAD